MKNITKWMLAAAMTVGGLGLTTAPAKAAQIGVYIGTGAQYVPPSPGPGYAWIAGYYSDGYWIPGRWAFTGRVDRDDYARNNFYGDRDDQARNNFYGDRDNHARDSFSRDRDNRDGGRNFNRGDNRDNNRGGNYNQGRNNDRRDNRGR
jgi:hypothetical protein